MEGINIKTFNIQADRTRVVIQSESTKFEALEFLMLALSRHFLDKGKVDRLKQMVQIIELQVENHKEDLLKESVN